MATMLSEVSGVTTEIMGVITDMFALFTEYPLNLFVVLMLVGVAFGFVNGLIRAGRSV